MPRKSPREEEARQRARARVRELEFAWASFLDGAMQKGAIPEADPRLLTRAILGLYNSIWQWYRPGGIFALAADRRVLQGPDAGHDGCGARWCDPAEDGGMTFFERYFERLDGDDPLSSLELVAPDVEFSIQWAAGADRRSSQFVGGLEELRGFVERRRHGGLGAPRPAAAARDGDVEFALGETRWDSSGERIGTFLCVAQLDDDGRMRRYMVARSPAMSLPHRGPDARTA